MRTHIGILVAVMALALGGGAQAVVGGQADNTPYVGAFIQLPASGPGFELCSGFMIGPHSFVTAAHCYDPTAGPVLVTFDPDVSTATTFTPATFVDSRDDVAVFTLQDAQPAWAPLPAPNASLGATSIDIVGYGLQGLSPAPGVPHRLPLDPGFRQRVTTDVKSAGSQADTFLKLQAGPGGCFGDSGGPNFISGTITIVAITSGGSKNCNGVSYAERIDTPAMLSPTFLGGYAGK